MNSRNRITAAEAHKLRKEHPDAPGEFIDYLRIVGGGSFRECQFAVFAFLGPPEGVCGPIDWKEPDLPKLCFGDNFSGDLAAFLPTEDWAVAEMWHDCGTIYRTKKDFSEYIREAMLMAKDGSDTSEA